MESDDPGLWDFLTTQPMWAFSDDAGAWAVLYHWFNLGEFAAWLTCAAVVAGRWLKRRNSALELLYAALFLCFALTDLREAWCLQATLVYVKIVNLGLLAWARAVVVRRWYPGRMI